MFDETHFLISSSFSFYFSVSFFSSFPSPSFLSLSTCKTTKT